MKNEIEKSAEILLAKVKETIKGKLISLKLDKCGQYTFTSKPGKWGASLRKYMSKIFANYRYLHQI